LGLVAVKKRRGRRGKERREHWKGEKIGYKITEGREGGRSQGIPGGVTGGNQGRKGTENVH